MEPGGDFVVAWHTYLDPETVSARALDDVSVRAFRANGAPAGPELAVNTYTSFKQQGTAVAADAAGNFVVVWNSPSDGSTERDRRPALPGAGRHLRGRLRVGRPVGLVDAVTDGGDLSASAAAALADTGSGPAGAGGRHRRHLRPGRRSRATRTATGRGSTSTRTASTPASRRRTCARACSSASRRRRTGGSSRWCSGGRARNSA